MTRLSEEQLTQWYQRVHSSCEKTAWCTCNLECVGLCCIHMKCCLVKSW